MKVKGIISLFRRYPHHRRWCRQSLTVYTWLFGVMFLMSPFLLGADTKTPAVNSTGVFGLDAELVKLILQASILVTAWLLIRVLTQINRTQNILHQNDRELARVLTEITTAHQINHPGQKIEAPRIGDSGGEL